MIEKLISIFLAALFTVVFVGGIIYGFNYQKSPSSRGQDTSLSRR